MSFHVMDERRVAAAIAFSCVCPKMDLLLLAHQSPEVCRHDRCIISAPLAESHQQAIQTPHPNHLNYLSHCIRAFGGTTCAWQGIANLKSRIRQVAMYRVSGLQRVWSATTPTPANTAAWAPDAQCLIHVGMTCTLIKGNPLVGALLALV